MDEFSGRGEQEAPVAERRAGYAEWVAVGAVVAGSLGAIMGATKRSHRTSQRPYPVDRPESSMLTAPHGDKLPGARD